MTKNEWMKDVVAAEKYKGFDCFVKDLYQFYQGAPIRTGYVLLKPDMEIDLDKLHSVGLLFKMEVDGLGTFCGFEIQPTRNKELPSNKAMLHNCAFIIDQFGCL